MKKSCGAKTLAAPTPTWVVGSYDAEGRPNVMTAAWGGICCSNPPCLYVSMQRPRYSYENIMNRQAFTVSVPSEKYAREADFFGIVSGRKTDKFTQSGLTPVKSELVDAPYVGEFPLVIECRLIKTVDLGAHTQFIGEIMDVKADEEVLDAEGLPDPELVRPIVFTPGKSAYHGLGAFLGPAFSIGKDVG